MKSLANQGDSFNRFLWLIASDFKEINNAFMWSKEQFQTWVPVEKKNWSLIASLEFFWILFVCLCFVFGFFVCFWCLFIFWFCFFVCGLKPSVRLLSVFQHDTFSLWYVIVQWCFMTHFHLGTEAQGVISLCDTGARWTFHTHWGHFFVVPQPSC